MQNLNSNDVTEILGISISTLKRWTENGIIECTKTAGGHRKFTMKHIRNYYKNTKNSDKNIGLGLERLQHKRIYDLINNNNFLELAGLLADASLESDELSVSIIINGSYMKGFKVEKIFDEIIEPATRSVENALQEGYLSHLESFISRKLISRTVDNLIRDKPNGSSNGKTALCVNFEDNLPDLGVIMSEVVLRHSGYNVFNTGSHADMGSLKIILEKRQVDLVLFYLCNMQCCLATVKENLKKTEYQTKEIIKLAKELDISVIFGGNGLQFLPSTMANTESTFIKYFDLKTLIS